MQLRTFAIAALPLVLAGIACSSTASFDSFPSVSGGGAGVSGPNGSGIGGTSGPCPTDPYTSQCAAPLVCEYGNNPSPACNSVAVCNDQGTFDVTAASTDACDNRCPTFDAPGALATSQGKPCTHGSRGNLICGSPYDRSTCGCTDPSTSDGGVPPPTSDASAGSDGGDPDASTGDSGDSGGDGDGGSSEGGAADIPGVWVCVTPVAGCPATRPMIGASCVRELTCDYGACLFPGGMKVSCTGAVNGPAHWVDETPPECGGQKL